MPLANYELEDEELESSRGVLDAIFSPVMTIAHVLDTPASILRGAIAGKDLNEIVEGIFSPDKRATGRDVLSSLGMDEDTGKIGSFDVAGLLTEVVADPLLFTGSITGLTKAGEAAKTLSTTTKTIGRAEQVLKNVQVANKLGTLEEAGSIAPEAFKMFQGGVKREAKLLDEGVEPLASTVKEQVSAGQRGLSFRIPFVKGEVVPTSVNEFLSPAIEKLNTGWDKVTGVLGEMVRPITKAFSTKKLTEEGQFFAKDMNEYARAEVDHSLRVRDAELAKKAQKIAEDIGKPLDEVNSMIVQGVEHYGKEADISKHFKEEMDLLLEKKKNDIARAVEQYQTPIEEGQRALSELAKGYNLDADSAPAFLDAFEKQFGYTAGDSVAQKMDNFRKSIKAMEKRRDTLIKTIQTNSERKAQDLLFEKMARLDTTLKTNKLVGHQGGIPVEFIQEIRGILGKQLNLEQQNGKIIEGLNDWYIDYMPHIRSAKANALIDVNKEAFDLQERVFNSFIPFSKERKFKNMSLDEINKLFRDELKIDFDFFETDPRKIIVERLRQGQVAIGNARNCNAAIQFLAEATPGLDKVHIAEVLKGANMNGFIPKGGDEMIKWGAKATTEDIKQVLKEKGIKDVWISANAAKDLKIAQQYSIGDLENIFRIFDPINQLYRTLFTTVPAYTGANLVGNMWMNSLVGLLPFTPKGFKTYSDAGKLLIRDYFERNPDSPIKSLFKFVGEKLTNEERALLDDAETFGGLRRHVISEIQNLRMSEKKSSFSKFLSGESTEGVLKYPSQYVLGAAREFNNFVEESGKLAHYMHQIGQGKTAIEAGTSVKKYLFDYADLTGFEKKVMRRTVLFYTFARKNLPLALSETLLNRQAYMYAKVPLAATRTEDFVPDYILDQGNLRVGPGHYLDLKEPFFEANRFSPQGGGLTRVFDKFAQQLVPWIKAPMELIADREFFRGAPLADLNRLPERSMFGVIPSEMLPTAERIKTKYGSEIRGNKYLTEVLRNLPWTRQEQISKDIMSEDIKPITSLFGLRERQLDPEKLRIQKTINRIQAMLGSKPSVRQFNKYFSIEEEPSEKVKNLFKTLEEAQKQKRSIGF